MNTNKTPAKKPLTKEQLDVIAASLMTGEASYKNSRMAAVARNLEGAFRGDGRGMMTFAGTSANGMKYQCLGQNLFQGVSGQRILLGEM